MVRKIRRSPRKLAPPRCIWLKDIRTKARIVAARGQQPAAWRQHGDSVADVPRSSPTQPMTSPLYLPFDCGENGDFRRWDPWAATPISRFFPSLLSPPFQMSTLP